MTAELVILIKVLHNSVEFPHHPELSYEVVHLNSISKHADDKYEMILTL